ncbi:tetratricopeptide repeat protein, partial [Streptomyces sp. SID337]
RASLVGLGLVPGVGALAGAVDPAQLAQGADRLRAGLSARFRNQEDVQLVLSPERVLTPVLLKELAQAAKAVPWIVLFFDTYERTGPFLDGWLHEVMTTTRHGALSAHVVVVTAGQQPFDTARWGGYADFVTDIALAPFTEEESRSLLAGKGVVAEPVVEEVLRLSGCLPVLVSTLAENRPADPGDVGDPSGTAVERFLKWEQDPVRRASALACALPRRLDADVVAAAVDGVCAAEDVPGIFAWLRSLPFVSDRGGRLQYHDVVRAPMLRLQRHRSPRGWAELQGALAGAYAQWRAEVETGREHDDLWEDEQWRELRLAESYHLLCGTPRTALPVVLRDVVDACDVGAAVARRWAQLLVDAGADTEAAQAATWGRDLLSALEGGGCAAALQLLIDRAGFDVPGLALARVVRGRELRESGAHAEALAEYDRAVALDAELERAYYGRGVTYWYMDEEETALVALDRAVELGPGQARTYGMRGEVRRVLRRFEEAVQDLDRALELDPSDAEALTSRGIARFGLGRNEEALADLDRALALSPDSAWALAHRARVRASRDEYEQAVADSGRAAELAPDFSWVAWSRSDVLRMAGRQRDSLAAYDRAIEIDPENWAAYAGRGVSRHYLDQYPEALADLDVVLDHDPDYAWVRGRRAMLLHDMGEYERALADADRAMELSPGVDWIHYHRAETLFCLRRYEEALADLDRALELDPDYLMALCRRGITRRRLGRYEEAWADLDRVLALEPGSIWVRLCRIRLALATGRTEQALTELAAYTDNGGDADWARRQHAELHVWGGRCEEALRLLAPDADGTGPDGTEELAEVYCLTGQWARARATAELLIEDDDELGTLLLALVTTCAEGPDAAAGLWHRTAELVRASEEFPVWSDYGLALGAAALGDWATADGHIDRLLGPVLADLEWDDLAEMVVFMTALMRAPSVDRARLAPRLDRLTAARDAFRYRHAATEAPHTPEPTIP